MRIQIHRAVFAAALASSLWAVPDADKQITYEFRSFAVCPGCPTSTGGINNDGLVGASGPGQGYIYDSRNNTATAVPGALALTVPANDGIIPGITISPSGIAPFLLQRDGTVKTVPGFPGAAITAILQLNGGGDSVGWASENFQSFFSFE